MRMENLQFTVKNIAVFLLLTLLLVACAKENEEIEPIPQPQRTILVYLAGDNNLSDEVEQKIDALKRGWRKEMGAMLLFADDTANENAFLMQLKEKKAKVFLDTLMVYKNANLASSIQLKKVLSDVKILASAPSYGMILFSHATGWLPAGAYANPTGWYPPAQPSSIFNDKNREMELPDFVEAIPDNSFDFMVFDMCFMAGVETVYALRNKTKYIVASSAEIFSPGFTPVYSQSLSKLYEETPDLIGFATDFYNASSKTATISVLKTAAVAQMGEWLGSLNLNSNLSLETIDKIQHFDELSVHLFFDFKDYCERIIPASEKNELERFLKEIVLYKSPTRKLNQIVIHQHSGLSVYVPQPQLKTLNKAYKNCAWSKVIQ